MGIIAFGMSNISMKEEAFTSLKIVGDNKLNLLLLCGPVAFVGSFYGVLGESSCFCLSGIALIPCAERLSFITEQLADHTNETIGALLNATFGNAPEFLISNAALRSGYYRIVQLTLLGSVLTNLLLVFGLSCLVGGIHWQIQELPITSGNASIGMLLLSTMGLVLPAALSIGNQNLIQSTDHQTDSNNLLSKNDVALSRFNSLVMLVGYMSYLVFQLGSHKDEFESDGGEDSIVLTPSRKSKKNKSRTTRRNMFCRRHCFVMNCCPRLPNDQSYDIMVVDDSDCESVGKIQEDYDRSIEECILSNETMSYSTFDSVRDFFQMDLEKEGAESPSVSLNSNCSDTGENGPDTLMSLRMSIVWLTIITFTISIMSKVLVGSIDGFAARSRISEVFTSVIIIPYFSNIAEQVSAIIFAYRNKMDLCIGVSVGSAIQINQFVMPGCVLVGWFMERPMTLYYQGYETLCLLLGVLCVAVVLQGGTTNWLVGVFFIGVYLIIAAGFWYHEDENLSE